VEEITIRPASFSDLDALVELIRRYYEHDRIAFQPEAIRSGLKVLGLNGVGGQAVNHKSTMNFLAQ
jgi:hypothetical protein